MRRLLSQPTLATPVASLPVEPAAIAAQNRFRSARPEAGGRPGQYNLLLPVIGDVLSSGRTTLSRLERVRELPHDAAWPALHPTPLNASAIICPLGGQPLGTLRRQK